MEGNHEAWEVFQMACNDPNGVGPSVVISVMDMFDITDRGTCLEKTLTIANEVRRLDEDVGKK